MAVEPGWIGAGVTGASFVGGIAAIGFRTLTRVTVLERRVERCESDHADGDRRINGHESAIGLLTGEVKAHEGRLDRIQAELVRVWDALNGKETGRRGH